MTAGPPSYGDPIPPAGTAMTPIDVVRALRWLGDLSDDELVRAVKAGAEATDLADRYPELSEAEIADLRDQARWMTRNRLRGWREGRARQPTWLEVRALVVGLYRTIE